MEIKTNIRYGKHEEETLDLYLADNPSDSPLFVFFHGGGLEAGNKGNGDVFYFRELAAKGISTATADYRMYPNAKFPDYLDDAAECVKWCADNVPHRSIIIGGSSAGGYITMMLAFDRHYLASHGIEADDRAQIAGYFADSGQPTVHFNVLRERGLDNRLIRVDEAAPVYFITSPRADKDNLPMYKFIVSDNDMVCRLEQNMMLYRTMIHMGYPAEKLNLTVMEGYSHTGYNGAKNPDGTSLYADMIADFIALT